ncbi:cation diffusion facilitator family transporter [Sinobaca qinghaiensis]|uniref:Cation diffusion facilitator family transporter n=1 Tax=Sinobaca qinghaiensis TaxID=342944 RepID=A0A419UZP5_9BACL|nr:cation transporter [Sinobaca qinghaiensis]RKD71152.1 cation diffusion facilitator family transporter [Sinobaca qinghaiensis]
MKFKESTLLGLSVSGALLFSIMGIIWGIAASSQMILFDGLYSFISLGLSGMSISAYYFMKKENLKQFQYGKESIEPLIVSFKALIITLLCIGAAVSSIYTLWHGGRDIALGSALVYAVVSTILCGGVYGVIRSRKAEENSSFLQAESAQWLMDTLLSAGVLGGFMFAFLLQAAGFHAVLPYVDPFMVLIISVYFLKMPYRLLRSNGRELIRMVPAPATAALIYSRAEDLLIKYKMQDMIVRTTKVGKTLYIDIDYIVDEASGIQNVKEMDKLRMEFEAGMKQLDMEKWVTITFTADKYWAV